MRRNCSYLRPTPGTAGPEGAVEGGLVERVADEDELGAWGAGPGAVEAKLRAGAGPLEEAAQGLAREMHEALRAHEPRAERLQDRQHAFADERCVVGERHCHELAAVPVAAMRGVV